MLELLKQSWWLIGLRGLAAAVFGAIAFFVPGVTLGALILMFAGYAIADGVLNLAAAVRHVDPARSTVGLALEGVASVVAGVLTLAWPGITALVLLLVIASWSVVTGVLELVMAIRLRKELKHEWLLLLAGISSVAFGLLLFAFPAAGALALTLWIGSYAFAFGVALMMLGWKLRQELQLPNMPRRLEIPV